MRRRVVRWTAASIVTAAALWVLDAMLRTLLLADGGFLRQLLHPSVEVVLARLTLMALGVLALVSLRGIKKLEDAREEAAQERRRLRELYEYTNDAIVFLDRELRIVYMNKAAERIGGKRLSDAVGWPCHQAIMGSGQPCPGCRALEVFETGRSQTATKYEVTDSGQENWLEQRWYPVMSDSGAIEAVVEVAHDITDRKLMEREVAALHKMLDARRGGPS